MKTGNIVMDILERKQDEKQHVFAKFAVDRAADCIYWINPDASFFYVNDAACKSLGYSREELLSMHVYDIDPNVDKDTWQDHWELIKRDKYFHIESQHRTKDGRIIDIDVQANHLEFEGKEYDCAFVRDITDRKIIENEAITLHERNIALVNSLGEVVYEWYPQIDKIIWEGNYKKILGYSQEEMGEDTQSWKARIHPDDLNIVLKEVEKAVNQNHTLDVQYRYLHKDGNYRWMHDRGIIKLDKKGELERITGIFVDITDHKIAEDALLESEEKFSLAFMSSPDAITITNIETGQIIDINQSFEKLFGFTRDDAIGKTTLELGAWDAPSDRDEIIKRIKREGQIHDHEVNLKIKTGESRTCHVSSSLINLNNEQCAISIIQDITDRKLANEALQESEERFRSSFEYAAIGKALVAMDHTIIHANQAMCKMLGYTKEELIGTCFKDLTHPDYVNISIENHKKIVEGKISTYHLEKKYLHKDGHTIWAYLSVSSVLNSQHKMVYAIAQIQDITERKAAEKELQSSKEHSHFLYEENPLMYFTVSSDGTVLSVNAFGAEELGYTVGELTGKSVLNVFPEKSHEKVRNHLHECLKNFGQLREWEIQKLSKNGDKLWVKETARAVGTPEGGTAILIVCRDITDQKLAEERLRDKVNQDEFVADFGRYILKQKNIDNIFNFAMSGLTQILNVEFAKILELMPDGDTLLLRSGIGWKSNLVGSATVLNRMETQAGYTLHSKESVIVHDLRQESRFIGPDLLLDHGVTSGISTVIEGRENNFGVLGVHSRSMKNFTQDDVSFVHTIANMLAEVIEHNRSEEELQFTHRALRVLSQCNDSMIRVSNEQSLLEEICNIIIDTGDYRLAWVGYPKEDKVKSVTPVAKSGHDDGYLNSIVISWSDDKYGRGPTGTTIRTGKPAIVRNVLNDRSFVPWRKFAMERGYASVVGLPLVYKNVVLGALTIYAAEVNAFKEDEVKLLINLADNLAYGIMTQRAGIESRNTQEQIKKSQRSLRNLATRLQAIREDERTRIAREIHDELGQTLTGLKMDLSWVREHMLEDLEKIPARIDSMISLVDSKLDETRKLAFRLRPAMLDDLGLEAAIECEVQDFAERAECDYKIDFKNGQIDRDENRDTTVFRILQEALTNIGRHANASNINVALYTDNSHLVLTVKDDGVGIDKDKIEGSDSLGILGMFERASAMHGQLKIDKINKGGTQVLLKLPLTRTQA